MYYTISATCPRVALVQHLEVGNYDYSEYNTLEGAWDAEKSEHWVDECPSLEDAKKEFLATLKEYSQDEILKEADLGYNWPIELGFVNQFEGCGEAFPTSRTFPGSWHDAKEGEPYISEWKERGGDSEGREVVIVFHFELIKGEEPEDAGALPWDSEHIQSIEYVED